MLDSLVSLLSMDLGLMKTYLWTALVQMKPWMNLITYCIIDLLLASLVAGVVLVALLHEFGTMCFISHLPRQFQGARRGAQCKICREIFGRRSTANRHFSHVHFNNARNMYKVFFKCCFPVVLGMLITRGLFKYV